MDAAKCFFARRLNKRFFPVEINHKVSYTFHVRRLPMILDVQKISKTFPGNEVLREVSFHIEDHEKAALVGINGAGKSTLLKIIMNEMPADSGSVTLAKGTRIGYLAQHQDLTGNNTIFEELMTVKKDILALDAGMRESERRMTDLALRSHAGSF